MRNLCWQCPYHKPQVTDVPMWLSISVVRVYAWHWLLSVFNAALAGLRVLPACGRSILCRCDTVSQRAACDLCVQRWGWASPDSMFDELLLMAKSSLPSIFINKFYWNLAMSFQQYTVCLLWPYKGSWVVLTRYLKKHKIFTTWS